MKYFSTHSHRLSGSNCKISEDIPSKLTPLPILIAGDFETNFTEIGKKCEQNTSQKQYINKLSCFSYAYKIHINENEAGISNDFPIRNYFAPDEKNCFQNFILSLKKDCFQLGKKLRVYFPLEMSKEDKLIHEKSTHCTLCKEKFVNENPDKRKTAHHLHTTGICPKKC